LLQVSAKLQISETWHFALGWSLTLNDVIATICV